MNRAISGLLFPVQGAMMNLNNQDRQEGLAGQAPSAMFRSKHVILVSRSPERSEGAAAHQDDMADFGRYDS
jgi:hypothetical protein